MFRELTQSELDFAIWVEQRNLRRAKPKSKWTAQDEEFMALTFDEWRQGAAKRMEA